MTDATFDSTMNRTDITYEAWLDGEVSTPELFDAWNDGFSSPGAAKEST